MKFNRMKQAIFPLDFSATHSGPGPFQMIVRGFSRYHSTVGSLPILEIIRLVVTTDFDAQRGRAFEQATSVTRAQDVERELRARVDRLTWEFSPTVTPMRKTTFSKMIDWQSTGVGATRNDTQNDARAHAAFARSHQGD